MALLNENQIDFVADLITRYGVNYSPLNYELVDHVCSMIEAKMDCGLDFNKSLSQSIQEFGLEEFSRTQEATLYLITLKLRKMKKTSGILGIISASLIIMGVLFKVNHLIGANIMLMSGIAITALMVLPIMAVVSINPNDSMSNNFRTVLGFVSAIILTMAAGFKILHWPYANILYGLGFILLTFGFMPMYLLRSYKIAENKIFSVAKVLLIVAGIAVFWGLVPKAGKSLMQQPIETEIVENK